MSTKVREETAACIFRVKLFYPEDRDSGFPHKVVVHLSNYRESCHIRSRLILINLAVSEL
jgi:hypothetical protein